MSELSKCILSILTFILTIAICIMFIQLRNKANELETRINYAIDFYQYLKKVKQKNKTKAVIT